MLPTSMASAKHPVIDRESNFHYNAKLSPAIRFRNMAIKEQKICENFYCSNDSVCAEYIEHDVRISVATLKLGLILWIIDFSR